MRRLTTLLLLLTLAGVTMGQGGCETEPSTDPTTEEPSTQDLRDARERKREKRAERKREQRRERERQEAQSAPDVPAEPEPAEDCEPGYDPCVPPYPPDLDCPDLGGPYSVSGSDPHGLDRDGDGTGCE